MCGVHVALKPSFHRLWVIPHIYMIVYCLCQPKQLRDSTQLISGGDVLGGGGGGGTIVGGGGKGIGAVGRIVVSTMCGRGKNDNRNMWLLVSRVVIKMIGMSFLLFLKTQVDTVVTGSHTSRFCGKYD